jgi:hypothetical protein
MLVLAAVAAAFAGVTPAANANFYNGCQDGDYVVADVTAAGREVAQVCTSDSPTKPLRPLLESIEIRCTPYTCR